MRPAEIEKPRRKRWPLIVVVVLLAVAAAGYVKKRGSRAPEPAQAVPATPVPSITVPAAPVPATPAPAAAPRATTADSGQDKFQRYRQAAEQEFRAADANNDGYLSQDEMRSRFPYLGKEFQRVDRDGDGRVSPAEYFQARKLMIERRFAKP